jgi:hypothetical protein
MTPARRKAGMMNHCSGLFLAGPYLQERQKMLSSGILVKGYHQTGYSACSDEKSPLHDATFHAIGTIVLNAENDVISHARLVQFIGADGDILWMSGLSAVGAGSHKYKVNAGMGKWKHVFGVLEEKGLDGIRADGHLFVRWDLAYCTMTGESQCGNPIPGSMTGDPQCKSLGMDADEYRFYDTGYSFHGPHATDSEITLANGFVLVFNHQDGVLISRNENSPRHDATCCDRGISILLPGNESAAGDIMLLEDTDSDGDLTWLFHEWWYETGSGRYEFIGGTGKWAGIQGVGKTLGLVRMRADDYWMPTWELRWKL